MTFVLLFGGAIDYIEVADVSPAVGSGLEVKWRVRGQMVGRLRFGNARQYRSTLLSYSSLLIDVIVFGVVTMFDV